MGPEVHLRGTLKRQVMSYSVWHDTIDLLIQSETGVSLYDLDDVVFLRDAYEAGRTPRRVVSQLLIDNGFDG